MIVFICSKFQAQKFGAVICLQFFQADYPSIRVRVPPLRAALNFQLWQIFAGQEGTEEDEDPQRQRNSTVD